MRAQLGEWLSLGMVWTRQTCQIPIQALSSRRLRLSITSMVVILLILLGVLYRRDALEYVPSWSRPSKHPESRPVVVGNVTGDVDWSKFAYVQYVTNSDYLCNSVMLFEILHRLGSRAERVMMYPSNMAAPDASTGDSDDARLLIKARDEYNVRLRPVQVQHRSGSDPTWADSFTKLLAFNQTEYSRVLSLDSDATILQPMDELFLLPPCPVAMPRAYWLYPDKQILSSQVMLVQPSASEFERIVAEINSAGSNDYDMEIVNKLYKDQALILPHRPYDMLTAEFRTENHAQYLGSDREKWDPVAVFNEAKFLHFSDWPVPKPWIKMTDRIREEKQPKCHETNGAERCIERELWNGFYTDFAERRERVCKSKGKRQTRKHFERNIGHPLAT